MLDLDKFQPIEPPRKWSSFQDSIFSHIEKNNKSAIIEAVAGSGKSTTILEGMNKLPSGGTYCFLAFNKAIAESLRNKVPFGVTAATFNSMGHRALVAFKPGLKLNSHKTRSILNSRFGDKYQKELGAICRLVAIAKASALGTESIIDDRKLWHDIVDNFDLDVDGDGSQAIDIARSILKSGSLPNIKEIDFDDQLYLSILWKVPLPQFDAIFVDESQDLNLIQHLLLHGMVKKNGIIIGVGDTHQAIYGFRGADSSSMNNLRQKFNALSLPLSITYRCPHKVVELAQTVVPEILAAPNAKDGIVQLNAVLPNLNELTPNDLLICRNNAPIMDLALAMLAQRLPMRVLGDFGTQLTNFIRAFRTDDMEIFFDRLNKWCEKQQSELTKKEKWSKLAAVEDKFETIKMLAVGHSTVSQMLETLARLFLPGNGPVLSSIHRAKGLEADRVFIIAPELMPSKYAKLPWMQEQEKNLYYVAVTRAKKELYFIPTQTEIATP